MSYLRIPALAVAALLALGTAVPASAQNSQQMRMRQCNTDARARGLTGRSRQAFIQTCLSRPSGRHMARRNANSCSAQARAKGLRGAAERSFMDKCLRLR